jgi:sulfate adenylyltransferase
MAVDNSLSPHGGELKVSLAPSGQAAHLAGGLPRLAVNEQISREVINLAYGVFSPLDGFMGRSELDSVVRTMRLDSGLVWSIPIILDVSPAEWAATGTAPGGRVLLTHQGQPLATLDVAEVYGYDKTVMAENVYGTTDPEHPGVARTMALEDTLLAGKVTLVNHPRVNPPFDRFWKTPEQLRARLSELGWGSAVAHQTRNVPHAGHEMMMKGALLASGADGILVSAVIGEKKPGDYIDEAIVLAHALLRDEGFFLPEIHETSTLMWDMRYAGPREAVFHALVRKNLGCTHHMFGRDHAGVGNHYGRYAAHEVFDTLPELGIKSVLTLEWWYCPVCESVAYEGICGHRDRKQDLAGTLIRSIISGQSSVQGLGPAATTLRPQVLEVVRHCAEKYGMGSPFVTAEYLENRTPVITMPEMPRPEFVEGCTCTECQPA